MSRVRTRAALKGFLHALSYTLFIVAAISFFVGGRIIHETWKVDRVLAEVIGIGLAVVCGFAGGVAKHAMEDLDWEEANEIAAEEDHQKSKP